MIAGEQPAAEIAQELGVRPSTVWQWARQYADDHGLAQPTSQRSSKRGSKATELLAGVTTEEELVERLKAHRAAVRAQAEAVQRARPPAGTRVRVPHKEQQSAVRLYLRKKASARDLADRYGVSVTTIHYWVRRYRTEHKTP